MDRKIPFMPPLNSWWRLTQDVALDGDSHTHMDVINHALGLPDYATWSAANPNQNYYTWRRGLKLKFILPAGTVLSFNRYHASNSGIVTITLQLIASPNPLLTPKKNGGKGKGAMRIYINLVEFNTLGEMEYVEN